MTNHLLHKRIAVAIPSYKVTRHIVDLIQRIPDVVWRIYVIDDACPDGSGKFAEKNIDDSRVRVIYHKQNQGVGGAVMSGYQAALSDGANVVVKIDGDDQMDPTLIPYFVEPILAGEADYCKGNRFYDLEKVTTMPSMRLFGNAVLSFMSKLSSGYWDIFDPTNGYTAIHTGVLKRLPLGKISRRFFFESDILFRLNTLRAVVVDIPMDAKYGEEVSNLKVLRILSEFLFKHMRNFFKRIFYNYYLRDLSLASIELPTGLILILFGIGFGGYHWIKSAYLGVPTFPGTVMIAAMPVLIGLQLLLSFIGYDISSVPKQPFHRKFVTTLVAPEEKSSD